MVNTMQYERQYTEPKKHVARDPQTYKNIGYLLCSFFFSLLYFVVLVTGMLLGIGTLIIWVGVPILFATVWLWWQFAIFERAMAMSWLGVTIAPMRGSEPDFEGMWQRFQRLLSNRMTWKILAYLLLKFPLSLCCFVFAMTLPEVCLGLMLVGLTLGLLTTPFLALGLALADAPDARRRVYRYLKLSWSCYGLNLLSLYLLNELAEIQGRMARGLLGMSTAAQRLEAARALAEHERVRAEQSEQRRAELVMNVSHELRAPVANIVGHLESLLLSTAEGTEIPPATTLHNYLSIAHQEAQRLGQLVDELLALARMEKHELRLNIREVPANEVVEEVYQMLSPLAQRERQITLVRGSQPHLPPVLADRQRLVQVLQNLVRNAIAYTPDGGIVSLSLEPEDERHLALVVEDNGIGIPPEELARVFERFYRVDASRSRATGGFGLGLAIVHDLVGAMDGKVSVKSTVGQGSCFRIILRCSISPSAAR